MTDDLEKLKAGMYEDLRRAVNGMFYASLRVDILEDRVLVLQSRDCPQLEGRTLPWPDYLERYARIMTEESAGTLRRRLSREALLALAEKRHKPVMMDLSYRIHGQNDWISIIVQTWTEEDGRPLACVFVRQANEDYLQRRIIDLYVYNSCDYFIYLDARRNSYVTFSVTSSGTPLPPDRCEDYEAALVDYANSFVVPEDREMVIREMHLPRVLEQLERHGVHTFYCGVLDPQRGYTRKQLTYRYYDREAQMILLSRTDVTGVYLEERARQKELQAARLQAETDSLTGLLNYGGIQLRVGEAVGRSQGVSALLFLDLDNFKAVNDTLGHQAGDRLLRKIAGVLRMQTREGDLQGRVGGDEFVLYLSGVGSRQAAENCAQRICEAVSRLSLSEHGVPTVSCSVGIAMVPEDGQDYNTLVRTADLRAYQAKAQGKNRYL